MRDNHIDFYRGIAFINMAIFHFIFNLQLFGIINFNIFTNEYTTIWRGAIVFIFLICVGITMVLVKKRFKDRKFFTFSINNLFLSSILISLVTYIIFPNQWIYFGILHFIFFAKIVTSFFVNRAFTSLVLAISIFVLFYFIGSYNVFIPLYKIGVLSWHTLDIIYIIPWLGVVFLGIFLGHFPFYKYLPVFEIKSILWLGKHSLSMYLVHQAILFPLVFVITLII
jgi:uncharacterized membrane protein